MSDRVRLKPTIDEQLELVLTALREQGAQEVGGFTAIYKGERYQVIRTRDPQGRLEDGTPDWRWHVSVSRASQPTRVPHWDALVAIVHAVRPGVAFVVGIPPADQWMNLHEGTLHAIEVKDDNLTRQWKFEAKAMKGVPT